MTTMSVLTVCNTKCFWKFIVFTAAFFACNNIQSVSSWLQKDKWEAWKPNAPCKTHSSSLVRHCYIYTVAKIVEVIHIWFLWGNWNRGNLSMQFYVVPMQSYVWRCTVQWHRHTLCLLYVKEGPSQLLKWNYHTMISTMEKCISGHICQNSAKAMVMLSPPPLMGPLKTLCWYRRSPLGHIASKTSPSDLYVVPCSPMYA